jgi:hypothetical protein
MLRTKVRLRGVALVILALGIATCNKSAEYNAADETAIENAAESNAAGPAPAENLVFCPVVDARISQSDCDDLGKVESEVKTGVGAFNVPNPMTRDKTEAIMLVVDRRSPEEIAAIENSAAEETTENASVEENVSSNETSAVGNETAAEQNAGQSPPPPPPPPPPPEADHGQGAPTPAQIVKPLGGQTERIIPKVGRFMSAELGGDGFTVKPSGPVPHEIPPGEQATWQWEVTPTAGGVHTLTLKTVVEGVVGGKRYPLSRTETVRNVQVRVSWPGWFADELDRLTRGMKHLELFLLGLAGLLGAALIVRWKWKSRDKGEGGKIK